MSSESLTAGSQALVNSLRESGEDVKVTRNVHMVVDTGDLQLMQACCCSAEVQTDFEPLWCLQNIPVSLDSRSEEMTVESAVVPMQGGTMIDLRNCDEFSIVHLEDTRDPSSQFVMLQTGTASEAMAAVADMHLQAGNGTVCSLPAGKPETEGEAVQVPVEIVGAPAMFVGGSGRHWKRELELPAESERCRSRQPADVDSGIWDMMQTLSNVVNDSGRSDLLRTSLQQDSYSEVQTDAPVSALSHTDTYITPIPPTMQGVYKMFQIADGSDSRPTESVISPERVPNKSLCSRDGSGIRQSSIGGLEDALEPVAVVDFVVHRIEAETVHLERVDLSDSQTTKGKLQLQEMNHTSRSHSQPVRTKNQNKPLLVGSTASTADQNADCSDGSCEDDELTHRSSEVTSVNVRSNRPAVESYDSATNTPRMKKKHKDVVRVTSARFGRSLRRRGGSRGRTSWKDPSCEARKSVSADVSRSSSLLDVDGDQQGMARSSEVYSDPSPEHGCCRNVKAASQYVTSPRQPFTSSPYEWHRSGRRGVESFTDGSSSTASGPMSSGLGLFSEPDLLDFEKFPDWMRDLPECLLQVPLSDICIPGEIFSCYISCIIAGFACAIFSSGPYAIYWCCPSVLWQNNENL